MQLNHIDLPVSDLDGAVNYFEKGFGFERLATPVPGMAILRGDGGFVVVLNQTGQPVAYPPGFHIGFLQPSDDAVHAVYQRLADAGLPLPAPPAVSYGVLAFYADAPGGILIEVSHRG
jgi:catechol 2,3-dioxygenase-like lactoylglutathione lyase family enzyme